MKMKMGNSRLAAASLALAALCSFPLTASASSSSPSTADSSLFRPLAPNSSLFALHAGNATDAAETAANWRAFERFLLSDSRVTPVMLLFTDSEAADAVFHHCEELASDQSEREWGEDALFPPEPTDEFNDVVSQPVAECLERAERHQLVTKAASVAAQTRSKPWDPIVVVPRDKLPQAFHYVSPFPSCLFVSHAHHV